MAFDEALAGRIRKQLAGRKDINEMKLFGGVGFMLNGNMCVGVSKQSMIVRLDPADCAEALREQHVTQFEVGGRGMKGWLLIASAGLAGESELKAWLDRAIQFVGKLPAK